MRTALQREALLSRVLDWLLAGLLCLALALLMALLFAWPLWAQVEPVVTLDGDGHASTLVRNPSRDSVAVTFSIHGGHYTNGTLVLQEAPWDAIVSPGSFKLASGEQQVVRLMIREFPAAGVLRTRVQFDPITSDAALGTAGVVAVIRSRLVVVGKVVAP